MTNDITTIAGALQEVIDRLEDNLDAKGVTVSYDSSDGIVGLVDEILNINVGGNCLVTFENQGNVFNLAKKRGSDGITVTIPNGIISLGDDCFNGIGSLNSVSIPSSVTTLGTSCFEASGLTSVSIPSSVTTLPNRCFYNCRSLSSVTLPSTISTLSNFCFYNCSNLKQYEIPSHITTLSQYCFAYSGLQSINIPSQITTIPDYCFYGCSNLTSVNLPSTLTTLGNQCFYYCTKLTSISIPASVTSLNMSFRSCSKLVDYQLYWDDPPITWTNTHMPNNTNTYYTIPNGTSANYIAKSFPSDKLIERS